jgi:hypothetical protein
MAKKNRCELQPHLFVRPFGEPEFAPGEGAMSEERRLACAFEVIEVGYKLSERKRARQMMREAAERLRDERPSVTIGSGQAMFSRVASPILAKAPKRRGKPNGKGHGAPGEIRGLSKLIRKHASSGRVRSSVAEEKVWVEYNRTYSGDPDDKRDRKSIGDSVRRYYWTRGLKKKMLNK